MPGRRDASAAATRDLGDNLQVLALKAPAILKAIEVLVAWIVAEMENL
jgi:hypothetical protein